MTTVSRPFSPKETDRRACRQIRLRPFTAEEFVDEGGLMSYGRTMMTSTGARLFNVDKILRVANRLICRCQTGNEVRIRDQLEGSAADRLTLSPEFLSRANKSH